MGMFDSVWARCPACGREVEFQSKAGDCLLHDYTPDDAPANVLLDLAGDSHACDCGHVVRARLVAQPLVVFE